MKSSLLLVASLWLGVAANANTVQTMSVVRSAVRDIALKAAAVHPAIFKVGDTANYSLTVSSMQGTMVMSIKAVNSNGVTMDQNVDMNVGPQGQQNIEMVIDPASGNVKSITVNGQPQTPPAANDTTIISTTLTSITVPAGTFRCQDVKMHSNSENTDSEQWVDMNDIPVAGLLKMTTTQQGMPVEADLTSFQKAP